MAQLGVKYAICVRGRISDKSSVEFSRGFYDALSSGKGVEEAYEEGCVCIRTKVVCYFGQLFQVLQSEYEAMPINIAWKLEIMYISC